MLGCAHNCFPVAASSATTELLCANTYMTPSTTRGSKVFVPGPVWYVQATSSCLTFDLLICLRDEYCEESAPPRYWPQVSKDCSAANSSVPHIQRNIGSRKLCADLRIIIGYPPTSKFITSLLWLVRTGFLYCGAKANKTFPGIPDVTLYPEPMKTMPPAMVGPIEPI